MLTSRTSNNEFSYKNDTRKTNKIVIATEDSKSNQYFKQFEQLYKKNYRIDNFVILNTNKKSQIKCERGNDPKNVYDRLKNHVENSGKEFSFSNEDDDLNDSFWISVDLDKYDKEINEIKDNFINFNDKSDKCYKMVISNPCFEVWKLFHIGILEKKEDKILLLLDKDNSKYEEQITKNEQKVLKKLVGDRFKTNMIENEELLNSATKKSQEKFKNCNNCEDKFKILMNNIFTTNMYEFIEELKKYKKDD